MPSPSVRKFLLTLLLGAIVAHLAWSAAMAYVLASSYSRRMIDVRRWPEEVAVGRVTEMVSMFLTHAARQSSAPTTLFVGSSVAYGYPWQEEVVVSTRYAELRPNEHVVNTSVMGADLAFMDNAILCGATNAGLQADTLILEIPIINSVNGLVRARMWSLPPSEPCDATIGRVDHWSFALRHPLGAGWLSYLWDDTAFPKPEQHLAPTKVYAGFFASHEDFDAVEAKYRSGITTVLNHAKTIGRRVYAFPSPIFLPGITEVGYDASSLRRHLDVAVEACRQVAGVHCLDPQAFYTRRELYWNLSHFNQRGNQTLAEWLAEHIASSQE